MTIAPASVTAVIARVQVLPVPLRAAEGLSLAYVSTQKAHLEPAVLSHHQFQQVPGRSAVGAGSTFAIRQGSPTETMPESDIIGDGEGQVANLVVHILEHGERFRPVVQFGLHSDVLEGRFDVEGHNVCCVELLEPVEVLALDRPDQLLCLLPDHGFVRLALHHECLLRFRVEPWLLAGTVVADQNPMASRSSRTMPRPGSGSAVRMSRRL